MTMLQEDGPIGERKAAVHRLLMALAFEILEEVRAREPAYTGRWVRTADVRNALDLNLPAVPKDGNQTGDKAWLFSTLTRLLEDRGALEWKREGWATYCRSRA